MGNGSFFSFWQREGLSIPSHLPVILIRFLIAHGPVTVVQALGSGIDEDAQEGARFGFREVFNPEGDAIGDGIRGPEEAGHHIPALAAAPVHLEPAPRVVAGWPDGGSYGETLIEIATGGGPGPKLDREAVFGPDREGRFSGQSGKGGISGV